MQGRSYIDLRCNKLLDSGLSGIITGAALRGIQTGPRAVLPGAMIVGAAATVLQYGYNELSIMRLRYISSLRRSEENRKTTGTALNQITDSPFQSLLKLFGVVPISDEEYLAKLKRSREIYLKRIGELENQIEEENLNKNHQRR